MKCEAFEELAAKRLHSALPGAAVRQFDEHIGKCRDCRALANELAKTQERIQALKEEPLSETVLAQVRSRTLNEIARQAREEQTARVKNKAAVQALRMVPLAASCALLLAVTLMSPMNVHTKDETRVPALSAQAEGVLPTAGHDLRTPLAPPTVIKLYTDNPNIVIYWLGSEEEVSHVEPIA